MNRKTRVTYYCCQFLTVLEIVLARLPEPVFSTLLRVVSFVRGDGRGR